MRPQLAEEEQRKIVAIGTFNILRRLPLRYHVFPPRGSLATVDKRPAAAALHWGMVKGKNIETAPPSVPDRERFRAGHSWNHPPLKSFGNAFEGQLKRWADQ